MNNFGQTIAIGFQGKSTNDDGVKNALALAEAGLIGGVIIYRYNIESPEQLKELLAAFRSAKTEYPLFIMLDQEGGKVQRIRASNGFQDFYSAQKVASEFSPEQAYDHYLSMGTLLKNTGFNFNFAPCVDVDHDPQCEVIGKIERSYGSDPKTVADYAGAMVRALRDSGIASCLKHFPGHGSSQGDTHAGLVDISKDWQPLELDPYKILQSRGEIDSIMSAHLIHNQVDKGVPATFSKQWVQKIRTDIQFDGVVVTDDLHMGAILSHYQLEEVVTRTLSAGHDLLIFSNNQLASQSQGIQNDQKSGVGNLDIAERALQEIDRAIDQGQLSETSLKRSVERIIALKKTIA